MALYQMLYIIIITYMISIVTSPNYIITHSFNLLSILLDSDAGCVTLKLWCFKKTFIQQQEAGSHIGLASPP